MLGFKEEGVEIINLKYIEEKDQYSVICRIHDLEPEKIAKIKKRQESGFLTSQGANIIRIEEFHGDILIEELYTKNEMDNYKSLIPIAKTIQKIPERLNPNKVEIEVDLCEMEREFKYRIYHASMNEEELKKHNSDLIKSLEELKEDQNEKSNISKTITQELVEGNNKVDSEKKEESETPKVDAWLKRVAPLFEGKGISLKEKE